MSIWESAGSKYLDATAATLPLHRLVSFGSGFLGSLIVEPGTGKSALRQLSDVQLSTITGDGILADSRIMDLAAGICLIVGGALLSWTILLLVFRFAKNVTRLSSRIEVEADKAPSYGFESLSDRQAAVELLESALKDPRAKLRSINSWAEMLCSLGVGLALASFSGTQVDLIAAIGLVIAAISLHFMGVKYFISDYFATALLKARLQGRSAPSPIDESP